MRILQRTLRLPLNAAGRGVQQRRAPARPDDVRARTRRVTSSSGRSGGSLQSDDARAGGTGRVRARECRRGGRRARRVQRRRRRHRRHARGDHAGSVGAGPPASGQPTGTAPPGTGVDPASAGSGFVSIGVQVASAGIAETLSLDRSTVAADALDAVTLDAICTPLDGGDPASGVRVAVVDLAPPGERRPPRVGRAALRRRGARRARHDAAGRRGRPGERRPTPAPSRSAPTACPARSSAPTAAARPSAAASPARPRPSSRRRRPCRSTPAKRCPRTSVRRRRPTVAPG